MDPDLGDMELVNVEFVKVLEDVPAQVWADSKEDFRFPGVDLMALEKATWKAFKDLPTGKLNAPKRKGDWPVLGLFTKHPQHGYEAKQYK